ncbi:MAG: RNA polymerase sigma factor [Chloroflexi bacterium]|nr:RNA polymerase sigma factor [Chloroflexota bacterium]
METENDLIQAHLRADRQAFRKLVERHTPGVYNLAFQYTRDPMEAENLTQETFLRVYRALSRFKPGSPFRPWLFAIAANLCRNWSRQQKEASFTALSSQSASDDQSLPMEQVQDLLPLPGEVLETEELYSALQGAFEHLPEHYRIVVTLYYTEGLSYDDIAQVLNIPLNTVRTHLRRAKQHLRQTLEQEFGAFS